MKQYGLGLGQTAKRNAAPGVPGRDGEGRALADLMSYQGAGKRLDARRDVTWHIACYPPLAGAGQTYRCSDRAARARAFGCGSEHPFRVLKRQLGHVKVRYRGLGKNTAQLHTLSALGNLWMVRSKLLGVMP